MAKKLLALTMVLVLVAGVAAAAQSDDATFSGSWENYISFSPNIVAPLNSFSSDLTLEYSVGGVDFESVSGFSTGLDTFLGEVEVDDFGKEWDGEPLYKYTGGFDSQSFSMDYSVGMLDLSSTLSFNPGSTYAVLDVTETADLADEDSSDPWWLTDDDLVTDTPDSADTYIPVKREKDVNSALEYWNAEGSLTLGGVALTGIMQLELDSESEEQTETAVPYQDDDAEFSTGGPDTFDYQSGSYSFGMAFIGSGETPGGISIKSTNLFGMKKVWDSWAEGSSSPSDNVYYDGSAGGRDYIVVDPADDENGSNAPYQGSIFELEGGVFGCCEFDNTTIISEDGGFEFTRFDFGFDSETWPLSVDASIKFEEQTKSVSFTPSLDLDWSCFTVYTAYTRIDDSNAYGLNFGAMEISTEFNGVSFSSVTALGGNTFGYFEPGSEFGTGPFSYTDVETYSDAMERISVAYEGDVCDSCSAVDFYSDVYFADNSDDGGFFGFYGLHGGVDYNVSDFFTIGTDASWTNSG
ncbi:MAG: hypothetical protein ACLFO3_00005, partial [Candidatus Acetothermia bacterium]